MSMPTIVEILIIVILVESFSLLSYNLVRNNFPVFIVLLHHISPTYSPYFIKHRTHNLYLLPLPYAPDFLELPSVDLWSKLLIFQ